MVKVYSYHSEMVKVYSWRRKLRGGQMLEKDHGYIKSYSGDVTGWKPKGGSTTYKGKSSPLPTQNNARIRHLNLLYSYVASQVFLWINQLLIHCIEYDFTWKAPNFFIFTYYYKIRLQSSEEKKMGNSKKNLALHTHFLILYLQIGKGWNIWLWSHCTQQLTNKALSVSTAGSLLCQGRKKNLQK